MFFRSIKFRLTIWYLVVLGVLLLIFATIAYLMLSNSLYQSIDDSLKLGAANMGNFLEMEGSGADFDNDGQFDFGEQPLELMLFYDTGGNLVLEQGWGIDKDNPKTVSYTHLTLPTNREV